MICVLKIPSNNRKPFLSDTRWRMKKSDGEVKVRKPSKYKVVPE